MAVEDYIGGIGGLMTMAALFAGNQQNKANQALMDLFNQDEEESTAIVPDATGTIETIGDDQKSYQVSDPARDYADLTRLAEEDFIKDPDAYNPARFVPGYTGGIDVGKVTEQILEGGDAVADSVTASSALAAALDKYYGKSKKLSKFIVPFVGSKAFAPVAGYQAAQAGDAVIDVVSDSLENMNDPRNFVDLYYKPETASGDSNYNIDKSMDQLSSVIDTLPDDHPYKQTDMYKNSILNPEFDNSYAAGQRALDAIGLSLPLTNYEEDRNLNIDDQEINYANPYSEVDVAGDKFFPLGLEIADIMQENTAPVPGLELSNSKYNDAAANQALKERLIADNTTYNDLLNQGKDTYDYRNIVKVPAEAGNLGFYSANDELIGLGVDSDTGEIRDSSPSNVILHEALHQADLGNDGPEELAVRQLVSEVLQEPDKYADLLQDISQMSEAELIEYLKKRKKEGKKDIPDIYLENLRGGNLSLEDVMSGLEDSNFNLSRNFEDTFANTFNMGGRVQHSQLPPERGPMAGGVGSLFKQK